MVVFIEVHINLFSSLSDVFVVSMITGRRTEDGTFAAETLLL